MCQILFKVLLAKSYYFFVWSWVFHQHLQKVFIKAVVEPEFNYLRFVEILVANKLITKCCSIDQDVNKQSSKPRAMKLVLRKILNGAENCAKSPKDLWWWDVPIRKSRTYELITKNRNHAGGSVAIYYRCVLNL